MVVARVLELGANPEEVLAGSQLEGGAHGDGHPLVAARRARPFVACRVARPGVGGVDRDPRPHRPRLEHGHRDRVGLGDLDVDRGRRVVVRVAAVTAVDEPPEARDRHAVAGRDAVGAGRGVDLDVEVLVVQRGGRGAHRPGRTDPFVAFDRARCRPTERGDRARIEEQAATRRPVRLDPQRVARVAEAQHLFAQIAEVGERLAGRREVQADVPDAVVGPLDRRLGDVVARELDAAHEVEHPTDLAADDDVGEGQPAPFGEHLRGKLAPVVGDDVRGP